MSTLASNQGAFLTSTSRLVLSIDELLLPATDASSTRIDPPVAHPYRVVTYNTQATSPKKSDLIQQIADWVTHDLARSSVKLFEHDRASS